MKILAHGFNTTVQDSNLGSRSRESAEPLHSTGRGGRWGEGDV